MNDWNDWNDFNDLSHQEDTWRTKLGATGMPVCVYVSAHAACCGFSCGM